MNGRPEEDNTARASLPSRDDGSSSSGNPTTSPLQTPRECQVKDTLKWPYIRGRFGYRSQHGVRSGMVAKQLQPTQWETLTDRAVGSDNRIRCVQKGLGSQLPRSEHGRPLVCSGKDPSHQLSRTTGCLSGSEVICLQAESNLDSSSFGQYYSNHFPEQNRGTYSPLLSRLAVEIWFWCIKRNLTIHAEDLPGVENVRADWELQYRTDSSDWKLNRDVFLQLGNKLGPFSVDMFASRMNAQLLLYCCWKPEQQL